MPSANAVRGRTVARDPATTTAAANTASPETLRAPPRRPIITPHVDRARRACAHHSETILRRVQLGRTCMREPASLPHAFLGRCAHRDLPSCWAGRDARVVGTPDVTTRPRAADATTRGRRPRWRQTLSASSHRLATVVTMATCRRSHRARGRHAAAGQPSVNHVRCSLSAR